MSIDLTRNFFRLLAHFRRHDLVSFTEEHDELFKKAKTEKDHAAVTKHYYSVMSTVIDEYFNGNFHFAPPERGNITLDEALRGLHMRIGKALQLGPGKKCLDIGCGIGGVIKDLEATDASITGITIAPNEVDMGNADFQDRGIYPRCQLVCGDCHKMSIPDSSFDAAYAIYALKYFGDLDPVLSEVSRVLKPRGLFAVYDLVKSDTYDENKSEQREVIEGLEYACGMPSLHTRTEMIERAEKHGLKLVEAIELSQLTGNPYYYCFTNSKLFMWLITSPVIGTLIKFAEAVRILPSGFYTFNSIFLAGTVQKIVQGGQKGILSGSEILLFSKVA